MNIIVKVRYSFLIGSGLNRYSAGYNDPIDGHLKYRARNLDDELTYQYTRASI